MLVALSALSLVRLRLDVDLLSQLPSASRAFHDYRTFLESFGAYDELVVLVRGDREALVPFADALADGLRGLPEVQAVRERVDVEAVRRDWIRRFRFQLLGDDGYRELAARMEPAAIRERVAGLRRALAAPMSLGLRRWIVDDPLGVDQLVGRSLAERASESLVGSSDHFVSPGGDALLVIVRPKRSAFDTIFTARLMAGVAGVEERLLRGPFAAARLVVGHTGSYVYALADREVMRADFAIYFVLAPLAVLAIFHLGLRTLRILPFALAPLLATTIVTFALSLALFGSLNMVSVAFAGIFYGLGIDSSIYFYALLQEKTALHAPASLRRTVTETLRELGAANVVASATTAAAFFVIGLSHFTGVSQLGVMTGVAMLANVAGTFVLLTAMVFAWGRSAIPARRRERSAAAEAYGALAERIRAAPAATLACFALVLAAAAAALPRVGLDTDFRHLRPSVGEAERVEAEIRDRFGASAEAQGFVLTAAADVDAALRSGEAVAERLAAARRDGLVASFSTLTAFLPSRETAGRRLEAFRALPRARAAADLRAALEANGFDAAAFAGAIDDLLGEHREAIPLDEEGDRPIALLRERYLRTRDAGALLATTFAPAPGVSLAAVEARLRADLPDVDLAVTGREVAEREFHRLLERELVWFLGGSLVVNLALVWLAERSVVRAAALLAPTLWALVVYLGALGALGLRIDPVNLIVLPLLIGLGVDDSVYLLAHVRFSGDLARGVARGVTPLLLAVGTTIAGFGALGLSRFPALERLGLFAALGLGLCFVATLGLVPALIGVLDARRRPRA